MLRSCLRNGWACWAAISLGLFVCVAGDIMAEPPKGNPANAKPQADIRSDANRFTYLDEVSNPYYVGLDMPKLTTPQWVGEPGVEAVITLGIDDMRESAPYERYLRPILERLKKIDGRAPVSIMTCKVDPKDPQLQKWLAEGLSLETHTADHPCPCLQGGDLDKAKGTYERCLDQLASVPGNRPVAFRFPCMDSLNTPSPRGYAEMINRKTAAGNFAQISTSVLYLMTADDPALPRELVVDKDGRGRMTKYVPFPSFVNKVYNYPYPYVIGKLCWEFACAAPDDWQGQNLHAPLNPVTVADYKAVIDATVVKQGTANMVFHPYAWIRNDQMVDVIDHVVKKHGVKAKFLNFRECLERINKHLLAGQPIRAANGQDNGVRLLDLNGDGFLDVVIGNEQLRRTRVWQPKTKTWSESEFPVQIVHVDAKGERTDAGVRFGVLQKEGQASFVVANEQVRQVWHFRGGRWIRDEAMEQGLSLDDMPIYTSQGGRDQGVRLRDVNRDGVCELLVGSRTQQAILRYDREKGQWQRSSQQLPEPIVDALGRDAGFRFVDLNEDGHEDIVFSNDRRFAVHLFDSAETGWSRRVHAGNRGDKHAVPMIVRHGTNNGAWFAEGKMWLQNEDTNRLKDGVDRRTFEQLLGPRDPRPLSPKEGLQSLKPRPGFKVELVAAEPLVQDPVGFDWGPDGRLWVVEMADYPLGIDDQGKPGGRVRYLEDTNGDGKYDKSTVLLDSLVYPTGVMAWGKGVLVSAAPEIFYAEDTTGDGKADVRKVLYRGFGLGNQQHRMNGFARGLDNWLHLANGGSGGVIKSTKTGQKVNMRGRDLRIRPSTGQLDAQTGPAQFGRHQDDWGNWFGSDNIVPLRHYVLADEMIRRNAHYAPAKVFNDVVRTETARLFPISRVLSHYQGYRPPGAGQPHRFTSACSTVFYRDNLFGPEFENNTFTAAPVHNLVHRRVVEPKGVTFTSRRVADEQTSEFLASTDSWFRPSYVRTGPDGALWVADMYRLVIEHPEWIDDELEKQLPLRAGHERGRIYRIYPEDKSPRPILRLADFTTTQLVAALESPNAPQRELAQQLLVERKDSAADFPLRQLLYRSQHPLAQMHAMATLDGLGHLELDDLLIGLRANHVAVQRLAIRLSGPRLAKSPRLQEQLLEFAEHDDALLNLELAYALGNWHDAQGGVALKTIAQDKSSDSFLLSAVMSSLQGKSLDGAMSATMWAASENAGEQRMLGQLMELAAASGNNEAIQSGMQILSFRRNVEKADPYGRPIWKYDVLAQTMAALARRDTLLKDCLSKEKILEVDLVFKRAEQDAVDREKDIPRRRAAIRLLGHGGKDSGGPYTSRLLELLHVRQPAEIQAEAVRAVRFQDDPKIGEALLASWQSHSPMVQTTVVAVLLTREPWTKQLLHGLAKKDLATGEILPTHRQRLLRHRNESIRKLADRVFAGAIETDRQALVTRYAKQISEKHSTGGAGDATVGQKMFTQHCAVCHRVGELGHSVGPDLLSLKDRSAKTMLTAVLDPNRAIEDKYRSYLVVTNDGQQFSGILRSETGTSITLLAAEGKTQVILRKDIEELQGTGKSLMPEGLESNISPADMAKLLAYLESIGQQ